MTTDDYDENVHTRFGPKVGPFKAQPFSRVCPKGLRDASICMQIEKIIAACNICIRRDDGIHEMQIGG